jgi:hypothetical protein
MGAANYRKKIQRLFKFWFLKVLALRSSQLFPVAGMNAPFSPEAVRVDSIYGMPP